MQSMSRRHVGISLGNLRDFQGGLGEFSLQLGQALAQRRIGLVYGGGKAGLMGVLADAALAAGGEVIGGAGADFLLLARYCGLIPVEKRMNEPIE